MATCKHCNKDFTCFSIPDDEYGTCGDCLASIDEPDCEQIDLSLKEDRYVGNKQFDRYDLITRDFWKKEIGFYLPDLTRGLR